jgi:hypothetical protein
LAKENQGRERGGERECRKSKERLASAVARVCKP